ncbi:MAG: extracellular solute-binding protein [Clostridia bacterium]|nr:extracellular solute-binding protein [Clostridia bacterium]
MRKVLSLVLVMLMTITVIGSITPAMADANELKFYDNNSTAARTAFFEKVFDEYYEATGVRFVYEGQPWANSATTVTTMFAGGNGPDVYTFVGNEEVAVKNGWLYAIDDYIAENSEKFVDMVTGYYWVNEKAAYGHNYCFPDATMAKGIYYRKDWVEEIGYEIPTGKDWNWNAFWDLAEKLTDPEKNRYGFAFRGGSGAEAWSQGYPNAYAHTYEYDPETLEWTADARYEGLKAYFDTYTNGYAPADSLNWGWSEQIDGFCSGLVGLFYNDTDCFPFIMDRMEEGTWGVLPIPYDNEGFGTTGDALNATYAYAISASSENVEACIGLMDFLYEPDRNTEYCIMMGSIPVRKDAAENEYFAEDGPLGAFVTSLSNPDFLLGGQLTGMNKTEWAGYTFDFAGEMQMYLLGELTYDEFFEGWKEWNQTAITNYLTENPDKIRDIIKMSDFFGSDAE